MATLRYNFGKSAAQDTYHNAPVLLGNPDAGGTLTTSGTSVNSGSTVATRDGVVRVYSDAAHVVSVGSGTQVAADDGTCWYIPASIPVDIAVFKGAQIAAITV